MVSIDYQGRISAGDTLRGTAAEGKAFASPLERLALDSRVAWRFENAQRRQRYGRLVTGTVERLGSKVAAFEEALARFAWPEDTSFTRARLVTPSNASDELSGRLAARVRPQDEVTRYYKYFSSGHMPWTSTDLAGGEYRFSVTQGGETETVDIALDDDATWGDMVEQVAAGINALSLPVQAEVVRQNAPNQYVDGLVAVGSALAITVNPAVSAQDVSLADEDGHLLAELNLKATTTPAFAAETMPYRVRVDSTAHASSVRSHVLDPGAASPFAAGEHQVRFSINGVTEEVLVPLEAEMTMGEVLRVLAGALNSSSGRLRAEIRDGRRPSGLETQPLLADGEYLEVTLVSPKRGERMYLRDYGGPVVDDVLDFFDPTAALPAAPVNGERYIASATANGWVENRIYEYDELSATWDETTPTDDNTVYSEEDDAWYFYDGSSWTTTVGGTLLDSLGMNATATPGMDARVVVDGDEVVSESGQVAVDKGRVVFEAQSSYGEALPLRVVEAYGEVEDRLADVVTAYNDLRAFVLPHQEIFEDGFADRWRAAITSREGELAGYGIREFTAEKLLVVDRETFMDGVMRDPDAARSTFAGLGGLVADWQKASLSARTPDLYERLLPKSALEDPGPPIAEEFDLTKRKTLQQVITSLATTAMPEGNPLLETTDVLRNIVTIKRTALTAPLAGPGGIMSRQG
ncbi:hypothetical protein ACI3L3_04725 [Desulfobaculum sp. SPO524]|uniref:hypothetical protein n=1 Tax=Desulfobaculum sp. SPO524 TaxID=3378071 RepID=UPI0038532C2F